MQSLNVFSEIEPWKRSYHIIYALLAKLYLKLLPNGQIIGITGSVGKTLTQNAISTVLSQKCNVVVGDENLDPTFRIPKTILKARPWDNYIILEYGVEHPGDMDYYLRLAKPKIAVITKITPTHLKYFGNEQGVYVEKSKLVSSLSPNDMAILNGDDPYCHKMAKLTKASIFWYGAKEKNGIKISHFTQDIKGSKYRLRYKSQKASVSSEVVGHHQLLSAYAAATVGVSCGLTLKQIAKGLSQVTSPNHRLNLIHYRNFHIIDDTYNSSLAAAEQSVNTLVDLGKRKTKIAVLGEMKDLGNLSGKLHASLGRKIAKSRIDYLVTVGNVAKIIARSALDNGFKGKAISAGIPKEATAKVKKIATRNSIILIKGSRHAHLERIVLALQEKPTRILCYHCGQLN